MNYKRLELFTQLFGMLLKMNSIQNNNNTSYEIQ